MPARTSNGYWFNDPSPAGQPIPPKSEKPTGSPNQVYFLRLLAASGGDRTARNGRKEALRGEGCRIQVAA